MNTLENKLVAREAYGVAVTFEHENDARALLNWLADERWAVQHGELNIFYSARLDKWVVTQFVRMIKGYGIKEEGELFITIDESDLSISTLN